MKPTTLLALNCPDLPILVDGLDNLGRCDGSHQHVSVLRGRDPATGGFRTAPAKQYPGQLNCLMANAATKHTNRCMSDLLGPPGQVDGTFRDFSETRISPFYVPTDPYLESQAVGHFGADCSAESGAAASLGFFKPTLAQDPEALREQKLADARHFAGQALQSLSRASGGELSLDATGRLIRRSAS